jgi:hypothetical protein
LRFALEAGESLRVIGDFIGQEFQGDEAMELDIFSFVDDTHPAATEFFDDAIARDGLPNHALPNRCLPNRWADILGPGVIQVNEGLEVGGGRSASWGKTWLHSVDPVLSVVAC